MRITFLTQYYPPEVGAPQVRLAAIAHELRKCGHQVHVVTAMPNYPTGKIFATYRGKFWLQEHIEDIPVTRTWIYAATGRNILKRLANYFSFTLSCLIALVQVPRADILFVESPPLFLGVSAWLIAALRRQKLCLNVSDLWPDSVVALGVMSEGAFVKTARVLELWLYRCAWRINGQTKGIVDAIIDKGIERAKILFLPNGVDTNLFCAQVPDELYIQKLAIRDKKVFTYTGVHGYAQGLDVIIEAAATLRHRPDILFLFVGDGPEKQRLQRYVTEQALSNVVFLDAQPTSEMPRIFALATACIVPLRNLDLFLGARPSKIFPALACEKPIIYSGAGEAATLIETAECGLVVPPEDSTALVHAVLYLADHPAEVVTMGHKGRTLVECEYSWAKIVEQWLADLQDSAFSPRGSSK